MKQQLALDWLSPAITMKCYHVTGKATKDVLVIFFTNDLYNSLIDLEILTELVFNKMPKCTLTGSSVHHRLMLHYLAVSAILSVIMHWPHA